MDPCLKVEEGDPLVHVDDKGDFSVNVLFTVHLLAGLEMILSGFPAREMSSGGCKEMCSLDMETNNTFYSK